MNAYRQSFLRLVSNSQHRVYRRCYGEATAATKKFLFDDNGIQLSSRPSVEILDINRASSSNPDFFHRSITARLREPSKRARNCVRKTGWLPVNFQGRGRLPDLLLQVDPKPFSKDYHSKLFAFERKIKWMLIGPLYELRVESGGTDEFGNLLDADVSTLGFERVRVLAQAINIHPITNEPFGLQLTYAPEDESVRVRIPIFPMNEDKSPGIQSGGYLNEFIRHVDVRVDPFTKPPICAIVDVGQLEMKERITFKDVVFDGKDKSCHPILPDSTVYAMVSKV